MPRPGWVDTVLPARQCDVSELGVHSVLPGPEGAGLSPCAPRDADDELDQRLATAAASPRGGLVLVTGPSAAGKPRALAAALGRTLPERMLVAPPEDADLLPPVALRRARFQENREVSDLHGPRDPGLVRGDTRPASDRRGEGHLRYPSVRLLGL
ncbi:hypothetical protein NE857_19400 [Nocardiopsis exhalans]|uniref:Sigma-54 factor interaction domain-containing protein n=1 Tax=Nocardiopsis exhalans TaxID=163604 RepID=A0ABY5CZX9_9ACTN|nr:hypothetical protein [Nocardiopsis exhalans]USY17507.1 hypothetical protein NE857_19400 [Nocardiopsis exhalans]